MGRVLIVGATGQLGAAVLRRLVKSGHTVRAFVRPTSPRGSIEETGVELAFGDLRDAASVAAACREVETVVATANAVVPRGSSSFEETEKLGYRHLIDASRGCGVKHLVFMSVPIMPREREVTTFRLKREIEQEIRSSRIPSTIFRGSLFMDDWFALVGSSIPLRGAELHTLRRGFWFSTGFLRLAGQSIEKRGLALVPGRGTARHAFVALNDVAAFLEKAVERGGAGTEIDDIGGPEILSFNEVVAIFEKVLGRKIRAFHTPAGVYRALAVGLEPFSPAASNLMAMSGLVAMADSPFPMAETAKRFGVKLTSAEEFLREKLALGEDADSRSVSRAPDPSVEPGEPLE
ncbi:MAG TPA: NmrA family NAD(P)-binding protein [Thermoanaerobaculia bacterium]